MTVEDLDEQGRRDPAALAETLRACCGASRWVDGMLSRHPYRTADGLLAAAEDAAGDLGPEDWLEAFAHHPRIGDAAALRARFGARSGGWSEGEQAGLDGAGDDVLDRLAAGNAAYEARFGHVFLVCATGKTAPEMLAILERRLANDPATELAVAAGEQRKITRLRLEKLLREESTA